jgi:hypothetical protein
MVIPAHNGFVGVAAWEKAAKWGGCARELLEHTSKVVTIFE